jgi:hypothetical protein
MKIISIIWFVFFCLFSGPAMAAEKTPFLWQGASMSYLLTEQTAGSFSLGELSPQFEVADGRQVLLLNRAGNLFDLASEKFLLPDRSPGITSLADSNGLLVVIREGRLGWYEPGGKIREKFVLPLKDMKIMAGKGERLYLYGAHDKGSRVYLLEEGKVLLLLEIPRGRITALTAIGERLFLAVENVIYTLIRGERPGVLFVAAGEREIRSLAPDPLAGLLYFSAGESVYAMRAGVAVTVMRGLKGFLRYSGKSLFVLDPERKWLVRIQGLEKLTLDQGQTIRPPGGGDFKE